jgi:integrin alpha 8
MERANGLRVAAVLVILVLRQAEGQSNIDTRLPIMRRSPGRTNESHYESHLDDLFGFAFAFHEMEEILSGDGAEQAAGKTRLIVGAPQGTFPGGLPLVDPGGRAEERTGLVYTCSITPDNTEELCGAVPGNDQTGVRINDLTITVDNDFLSAGSRLFDQRPNAQTFNRFDKLRQAEHKTDQFLGATVFTRDGRLLVCAPIWTPFGLYNPAIASDENSPAVSNALPQGRCYYTNRELTDVNFLDPCNVQVEQMAQVDRGYCTTGTDVDMLETSRFVIGSTGYLLGVGTLFYGGNQNDVTDRSNNTVFGRGNLEHTVPGFSGQRLVREVSQGYQVATGFITEPKADKDTTATPPNTLASSPRFDSTRYFGKIDIYDARSVGGDIQTLLNITAEGTQMGEFFGYSMDTVDINGDLYDDVVVGAPMFSQINSESEVLVETGRVYVFINVEGNLSTDSIVIEGTVSRARLGMAVLGVGDIDRDGFGDFAVSAPYEPDGDSTGVVYVYYGSGDLDLFRSQTPVRVSSQATADSLSDVTNFTLFGWSLATHDLDNNGYNDLAIGAPGSAAVVVLRSRPVAVVNMTLTPSVMAVVLDDQGCMISGVEYSCFSVTVNLDVTGDSLPNSLGVRVSLREVRLNGEQRIFFYEDDTVYGDELVQTVTLNPTGVTVIQVYLLNFFIDSESGLQLEAEVLPNDISQPASPGDGQPQISDLTLDFLVRQASPVSTQVGLANDCGEDSVCQTDFGLSVAGATYLPDRGLNYQTIEVGGVELVRVGLTLTNDGDESAIVLQLDISHSVLGVFTDKANVEIDGRVLPCARSCNIGTVRKGSSKDVRVLFEVESDPTVGPLATTFTLTSNSTVDNITGNNEDTIDLTVDRRADLKISVIFSQDQILYGSMPVKEPLNMRSDVGAAVSMEVKVSNAHSTDISKATVDIFYPARAQETGDLFYLLPDCRVSGSITGLQTVSDVKCEDDLLGEIETLNCDGTRRKRHSVSPVVKQRWRRSRETRETSSTMGLFRRARATSSSVDCSANPADCLKIRCTIPQLRGLAANEAEISFRAFVDERFFSGKNQRFELTAMANVSFNATGENVIDVATQPDSAVATITISPTLSSDTEESQSRLTLIFVILAVIIGPIIIITIITIILWRCGFFKRKRKLEEEDDEIPAAPPVDKDADQGTDL